MGGDGILDGLDVGELRLRSGLESDLREDTMLESSKKKV